MRYLKKFEGLNDTILKTYFVYCFNYNEYKLNNNITHLEILKKVRVEKAHLLKRVWNIIELYYEYGKFREVIHENNPSWIDEDSEDILFTSNNLEECKEFILLLTTTNKYNL